ncbi:MAG: hypothetical protein EKK34_32260 [Mycobacterium sp.]|nr:MAG: hypothetical protein EKK34_32260 [Mycobacterium sp.]
MKMPNQRPVFQGNHPSNLIGWPTFQPSRLAGLSTVVNRAWRDADNHCGRSSEIATVETQRSGRGTRYNLARGHPARLEDSQRRAVSSFSVVRTSMGSGAIPSDEGHRPRSHGVTAARSRRFPVPGGRKTVRDITG